MKKRNIFIICLVLLIILVFIFVFVYLDNKRQKKIDDYIKKIVYVDNEYKYEEWTYKYVSKIILSLKEYLTDEEISNLFKNIYAINYIPYDPSIPDKTIYDRAHNTLGIININGYKDEDINIFDDKMLLLICHEILHSLGEFSSLKLGNLDFSAKTDEAIFLEEGMSYIISEKISDEERFSSFVLYNDEMLRMFMLNDDLSINVETNRSYTISFNIAYNIYALGCFDYFLDSNISGNWNSLKSCFYDNFSEDVSNNWFNVVDKIYLYVHYPNMIFDNEEAKNWYFNNEKINNIIDNSEFKSLLFEFSKLSIDMLDIKYDKMLKDNNYSKKFVKDILKELDEYERNGLIYHVSDKLQFVNEDYDRLYNKIESYL